MKYRVKNINTVDQSYYGLYPLLCYERVGECSVFTLMYLRLYKRVGNIRCLLGIVWGGKKEDSEVSIVVVDRSGGTKEYTQHTDESGQIVIEIKEPS